MAKLYTYKDAHDEFFAQFTGEHTTDPHWYEHPNIITPDVLAWVVDHEGRVVEVSFGYGLFDEPLFGMTYERNVDGLPNELDHAAFTIGEVIATLTGKETR